MKVKFTCEYLDEYLFCYFIGSIFSLQDSPTIVRFVDACSAAAAMDQLHGPFAEQTCSLPLASPSGPSDTARQGASRGSFVVIWFAIPKVASRSG